MAKRDALHRRAAWTLVDQAISSFTNAGLAILVARSVDAPTFGAFGIGLVVFSFGIGLARAVVTDPLVIRYSAVRPGRLRAAAADAAGASLLVALGGAVLCLLAGAVLGGVLQAVLTAMAVVLPGLLVQDAWRNACYAAGRPSWAAVNDLVWSVATFSGIALLLDGRSGVSGFVLVWGAAAYLAAVVGSVQLSIAPRPARGVDWLVRNADLGKRMGPDFLISMGAVHLVTFLVGAVAGLAAAGALRAAQTLLGPVQVLFAAITSFVLPVLSRRAARGGDLLRPALVISAVTSTCALAWVLPLLLLPDRWGVALLGASWTGARSVLMGMGAVTVLLAVVVGATLSLKASMRPGLLLRVTLVQAPSILVLAGLGAAAFGATGAAWGLAGAHLIGTAGAWWAAWQVLPRRQGPSSRAEASPRELAGETGPSRSVAEDTVAATA